MLPPSSPFAAGDSGRRPRARSLRAGWERARHRTPSRGPSPSRVQRARLGRQALRTAAAGGAGWVAWPAGCARRWRTAVAQQQQHRCRARRRHWGKSVPGQRSPTNQSTGRWRPPALCGHMRRTRAGLFIEEGVGARQGGEGGRREAESKGRTLLAPQSTCAARHTGRPTPTGRRRCSSGRWPPCLRCRRLPWARSAPACPLGCLCQPPARSY